LYLFRLYGYLRSDAAPAASPAPAAKAHAGHASHGAQHGHGEDHAHEHGPVKEKSPAILAVLALLTLAAPAFGILSASPAFSFFGKGVIWSIITGGAAEPEGVRPDAHTFVMLLISLVFALGCFLVFANSKRREALLPAFRRLKAGSFGPLSRKFYFDDLYAFAVLLPLKGAAYLARLVLENIFTGVLTLGGWLGQGFSLGLRRLQTGKAHQYALGVMVIVFALVFWLGTL
jgi:hypothetical protein